VELWLNVTLQGRARFRVRPAECSNVRAQAAIQTSRFEVVDPLVRKEENSLLLLHCEIVNDLASALQIAMVSATPRPSIVLQWYQLDDGKGCED
jgi:hypothetical protein